MKPTRAPSSVSLRPRAVRVPMKPCPLVNRRCEEHEFIHGAEAEELRSGIEKVIGLANHGLDYDELVGELRNLLDKVDARDSLAFVEKRPPRRKRRQ